MHKAIEDSLVAMSRFQVPTAIAYAGSSVYAFLKNVPPRVDGMTPTEALVRVSETAILSIPQILGGIGILMGGWFGFQIRKLRIENDRYKDTIAHEQAMARITRRTDELPRVDFTARPEAAKPDEPTVDLK